MAEKHEIVELGNVSCNGKRAVSPSSVARSSKFVPWVKALFGSSKKGTVRPPKLSERSAASSSWVSSSARIERMMRSRTGCAREVDWEIEASEDHWSELEAPRSEGSSSDPEDERVHLTNGEIVKSLRSQFPQSGNFFRDSAGYFEVGEKIAEGAQADIFTAKLSCVDKECVVKVFKEGSSVRDLQKQWPLGMLNRSREMRLDDNALFSSFIWSGTVVMNGRFAFLMWRAWGDLRKLIDKRMESCNRNRCPPLNNAEVWCNMNSNAMRMQSLHEENMQSLHEENMQSLHEENMQSLHEENIMHRDLKASNVLIRSSYTAGREDHASGEDFLYGRYSCVVADYECSVGVVWTGFWRAPEILQGVKDRKIRTDLFTKKSDVYSFAMTCYEMIIGQISFEGLALSDYDVVLQGGRPVLREGTKFWIKELLSRCWHHGPTKRPDFVDIVKYIRDHYGSF